MELGGTGRGGDNVESMTTWTERLVKKTERPVRKTGSGYWAWLVFLIAVVLWGAYAYSLQLRDGLIATDMRDRISWGLYISLFIFFTGVSMAGTVISAMLRASKANWRVSITRTAEFITAIALLIGALFIVVDMGRPERLFNVYLYGRWQSPIMWDVMAITTYLTASVLYLYTPMIPDLAMFRDRLGKSVGPVRRWIYRTAALDWAGTRRQWRALARSITVLMVIIIPIAVSVHSVVSWIFGMTLRVGWNTSIFGILFVAGAIFSGLATLIVVLAILRKIYHWNEYITELHFRYLGYLMAILALFMIYMNISEYLTAGFKFEEGAEFAFRQLFLDDFAGLFGFYLFFGLVVPVLIVLIPKTRTVAGIVVASILVIISMFIERYFLVVTALRVPLMPYEPADYFPSWIEWSIAASGFAFFALLISIAVKVFPMLAVWEMVEEHEQHLAVDAGEEMVYSRVIAATDSPAIDEFGVEEP